MAKTSGKPRKQARKRGQRGGKMDLQTAIEKTGIAFHIPSCSFAGPGTRLQKRLKRGDKPINWIDEIAMYHDIANSKANGAQTSK